MFSGEIDLNLFVGFGGCLYLSFLVCSREDAEGDRYAGFKVQVGDLNGARVLSSTTFRLRRKEDKKIPLALLYNLKEKKGGEAGGKCLLLYSILSFRFGLEERGILELVCWVFWGGVSVGFVMRSSGRKGGEVSEEIIGREEIGRCRVRDGRCRCIVLYDLRDPRRKRTGRPGGH